MSATPDDRAIVTLAVTMTALSSAAWISTGSWGFGLGLPLGFAGGYAVATLQTYTRRSR